MDKSEKFAWRIPWKGIALTFMVSMSALVIVVWKMANPTRVLQELGEYPLTYFFGALFFVLAAWVVDGQRIGTLAKAAGHDVPWWQMAITLGAANFLTLVTPFAGGGGALVVYFLYRRGLKGSTATAIVMAGGLAGQLSLASLGLLVFSTLKNVPPDLASYINGVRIGALLYIAVLITLLVLIVRSKRFFKWIFRRKDQSRPAVWIEEFRESMYYIFVRRGPYFLKCFAIAFFYYVVYFTGSFLLLSGFGVYSPWLRYGIAVLFGIAPVFSPIPGGAGVAEGIAWFVLDGVLTADLLSTFIVLWRSVVFYIPIVLGGTIFALMAMKWASKVILPEEPDHTKG
ncbi:MAG: YbhN family protein [Limnochordia bacterium]|nr:YbhN family protein [Limnochordia bacterium]